MQINLTIDRGNSAFKAVVWEGRHALWRHTFPDFSCADAKEIARRFNPGKVIFCSVASETDSTFEMLKEVFGSHNVIALSHRTPLPIAIDYATPHTLGLDRVAAAVGGMAICPGKDLLIVDIGTAVTFDCVSADGRFKGGNIAPGVGLRLESLHNYTARLPLVSSKGECPLFGTTTETAIRSGSLYGIVGEIMYYYSSLPTGTRLILTGGWGGDIAAMLPVKAIVKPCLVSIGLNSILSYNETK